MKFSVLENTALTIFEAARTSNWTDFKKKLELRNEKFCPRPAQGVFHSVDFQKSIRSFGTPSGETFSDIQLRKFHPVQIDAMREIWQGRVDGQVERLTKILAPFAQAWRDGAPIAALAINCWRSLTQPSAWKNGAPTAALAASLASLLTQIESVGFREPDKQRSYVDADFAARVAGSIIASACAQAGKRPAKAREVAAVLANLQPSCRALLLQSGWLEKAAGKMALAEERAHQLLNLNAVCPDSQKLLFDVLHARQAADGNIENADISLADLSDRFCQRPFTTFVTGMAGESFLCDCPAYLPFSVGNVLEAGHHDAIWNGPTAQEQRRSILDGDFKYCSRTLCGLIKDDLLPRRDEVADPMMRDIIDNRRTVLATGPSTVQLSHDASCNLACPSCRTKIIALKGSEQGLYDEAQKRVVTPLLAATSGTVMISGGGDPFASKHYRSVIESLSVQTHPHLKLCVLTNGLMLTPKQWGDIATARPLIATILVSVDAATAETYEVVRRPGNWSTLMPNLEFLGERRRAGEFGIFGLCFVVQKLNFEEMPAFVRLGRQLGADVIWFQRLVNFGSYTPAEIVENDVAAPGHPLHDRFKAVLATPELQDPIVSLFSAFLAETGTTGTDFATLDG